MIEQPEPTIREKKTTVKGRTYQYWLVDWTINKHRERKNFKTEAKAKHYILKRKRELTNEYERKKILFRKIGEAAAKLNNDNLNDAVVALNILSGRGSLADAASFYTEHHDPDGGKRTVTELFDEYVSSRIKAERRERTIRDIKQRLGSFKDDFLDVPVDQITTADMERWLDSRGGNGISRNNNRVHLVGMFNYAKSRKYIRENRASVIERVKQKKKKPFILVPEDVEKLLNYTNTTEPNMIPYFALCVFAGIRPTECQRLDWKDIDLKKKQIYIQSSISKTGDDRYIDMSDNLISWLLPYKDGKGLVFYKTHIFRRTIKKAGIRWKVDCLRHSYGTYHVAMHDNAGKTALNMGHRELGTLFDHYQRAVEKSEAERFWSIRPRRESNIIRMAAI